MPTGQPSGMSSGAPSTPISPPKLTKAALLPAFRNSESAASTAIPLPIAPISSSTLASCRRRRRLALSTSTASALGRSFHERRNSRVGLLPFRPYRPHAFIAGATDGSKAQSDSRHASRDAPTGSTRSPGTLNQTSSFEAFRATSGLSGRNKVIAVSNASTRARTRRIPSMASAAGRSGTRTLIKVPMASQARLVSDRHSRRRAMTLLVIGPVVLLFPIERPPHLSQGHGNEQDVQDPEHRRRHHVHGGKRRRHEPREPGHGGVDQEHREHAQVHHPFLPFAHLGQS